MTRTLRRLARIQRLQQDEARTQLVAAQRRHEAHDAELEHCCRTLADALADAPQTADEMMRRHSFSLRQEMQRRRLQAQSNALAGHVESCRGELVDAARKVKTTETFSERLEARAETDRQRRHQRELDEVGVLAWARGRGGQA